MNVPTIEVDRDYARKQLMRYEECLERAKNEEYELAVKALREAAEGRALISVNAAFEQAGLDEQNRPKLAIARADRRQVRFRWADSFREGTRLIFDTAFNTRSRAGTLRREIAWSSEAPAYGARKDGYSLVPIIPPDVRIEHPQSYDRKRFILWEVEEWFDRPLIAVPDRDPLLLEHIHEDLYAVLAAWDLTDLERMIMLGRRTA